MPALSRTNATGPRATLLESEHRAGVLILTLARPETRNSLSQAMIEAMQGAIDAASQDAALRAVVVMARGTAFCAGHDLKELTAHRADADGGRAFTQLLMHQCS